MTHEQIEELQRQLEEAQAERDALQARVDVALVALQINPKLGESPWRALERVLVDAIKILTKDGE